MKKDIANLAALTCIQGANALAPLVIFPYALRTLGSEAYAALVLSEALALLVLAVVVFSFEVVGVASTVQLKSEGDNDGLSRLFSSILYIRGGLLLLASGAAVLLYQWVLGGEWITIGLWMMIPLAYILQSNWLFQGIERNIPPALFTLLSRLACVGCVIMLVRTGSDKHWVPAIMGSTYLVGGLGSFAYAVGRYKLRLQRVGLPHLLRMVNDGKEIFLGNVSVSLSRDVNVLILGLVGIPAASLSAYSVAEKLTKSLQAIARPLNQLFFPKAVRAIQNESEPSWPVAARLFRQTVPQLVAVALILLMLAIAYQQGGKQWSPVSTLPNSGAIADFLGMMAFGVFFGIASFMFGSVGLNQLGSRGYYFAVILFVGVLSALTCFALAHWIGALAAACCYLGSEILTALLVIRRYRTRVSR